ncbi:MAG: hypothetical protein ACRCVU_11440 [Flavobacterium sp.]
MIETNTYQFYGRHHRNMVLYFAVGIGSGIGLFMLINTLVQIFSDGAVSLTLVPQVVLYIFPLCILLCFRIAKYMLQKWEESIWRVEMDDDTISFTFKEKYWCFNLSEIKYVRIYGEYFKFDICIETRRQSLTIETLFNQDEYLSQESNKYVLYEFLNALTDGLDTERFRRKRKLSKPIKTSDVINVTYKVRGRNSPLRLRHDIKS